MHCSRRRIVRTTALTLLMLMVAAGSAQAAKGGNSENAKLCQNDGWMGLVTSTGAAFTNPGECVAYAARGGALSPRASLVFELGTCYPGPFALKCPDATLVGSGLEPGGIVHTCALNPDPQHPDAFCYPQFYIEADGTINVSWDETAPFDCVPGVPYNYNASPAADRSVLIFTSDTC